MLAAGTAAFALNAGAMETNHSAINHDAESHRMSALKKSMASQATIPDQQAPSGTQNVFGGDHFDPAKWLIVPAKTFDDLKVGDVSAHPAVP